jgi:hypothetical protein
MEQRKPTATEIVHSLDRVRATQSRREVPDDAGCEPLWAPLVGRNFDAYLGGIRAPVPQGELRGSPAPAMYVTGRAGIEGVGHAAGRAGRLNGKRSPWVRRRWGGGPIWGGAESETKSKADGTAFLRRVTVR